MDIPDHKRYRNTDPDTSKTAVEENRVIIHKQAKEVLEALKSMPDDFTAKELAHISWIPHNVICRRLPELEEFKCLTRYPNGNEKPYRRDKQQIWFKVDYR